MISSRLLARALVLILAGQCLVSAQEIDQELTGLADKLAAITKENKKQKVTVLDFTDLQGGASELGKYIAEELTVNLVIVKKDFAVLDRANLKKILAEHKLTATGLVDPDTAKKLGQFAGVDALILGTIIPKGDKTQLTAKVITTDTAEIIGAARAEFKSDENSRALAAKEAVPDFASDSSKEKPKLVKLFGDLCVQIQSLKLVNDKELNLQVTLTNRAPKKSIWVALGTDMGGNPHAVITDANGYDFHCHLNTISGIASTAEQYGGFFRATEIKPGEAISATIRFFSRAGSIPATGGCNLQLEILLGTSFDGKFGRCTTQNLTAKLNVE